MIVIEHFMTRSDGVRLRRIYSDQGYMLLQNETGNEYAEAIDVEGAPYTYSETNRSIFDESTDAELAKVIDILTGVIE